LAPAISISVKARTSVPLVGLGGLRRLFDSAADHRACRDHELPVQHDGCDHDGFHGILGFRNGRGYFGFQANLDFGPGGDL
jgi:hypothetical protein